MVTVRVQGRAGTASATSLALVVFKRRGTRRLELPWIPDEIERSNYARTWDEIARPGRTPLLIDTGGNLPKLNLTVRLVGPAKRVSVGAMANELTQVANSGRPVLAILALRPIGLCNLTGLTIRETEWNAAGNAVDAEADLELTTISYAPTPVGPVPTVKRRIRGTVKNAVRRR